MATSISNPLVVEFVHAAPGALDFTPTRALRVFDARGRVVTAGGAGGTSVTISNVAAAITDGFSLGNAVADAVGRAAAINDANYLVPAGGTLRSTTAQVTACRVYVYCYGA